MPVNLHWKYYVDYFSEPDRQTGKFRNLEGHNQVFYSARANSYQAAFESLTVPDAHAFSLTTTYPGLLVGSGYRHQTGSDNELKLGFSFDFTTGLPIIPGSSVKGMLRSVFPAMHALPDRAIVFIRYLLATATDLKADQIDAINVNDLETELFGPDKTNERTAINSAVSRADIFYDALIGIRENRSVYNGKLFDKDFITPHRNRASPKMSPFTNPVPIQFLKVMPQVPVLFQFNLRERPNQLLSVDHRLNLFRAIITEVGIGAKTRVGYGQLI